MSAEIVYLTKEATKFDVHLMLRETSDGGLHGDLIYSSDLFADDTMKRFANQFCNLVKSISMVSSVGDELVQSLPILHKEEADFLRVELNETSPSAPYPPLQNIALSVIKSAELHMEKTAVEICGGAKFTYGDLLANAKEVAAGLEQNYREGPNIALLFEKGFDM
jgi:non-ribosomal peptide synthetase component F